ncbi:MAG TPA: hypothetical protein VGB25_00485 [Candidatus Binatia bacterium]
MSQAKTLLNLLERILPLPTAPFHERFVSAFIQQEARNLGLDPVSDPYGNILVGRGGAVNAQVACVAHMDHPGFEVVEASATGFEATWFGGVEPKYFAGSPVVVYEKNSGAVRTKGRVEETVLNAEGRVERMTVKSQGAVVPGDFGTWDLVPFCRRGETINTKGADDLVGCALVLATMAELEGRTVEGSVVGLFTRAEEVGFIGTLGIVKCGLLPPHTPVVSIETSKAVGGVRLGGGPVIRLGDRTSMFDPRMVLFMDNVARELQARDARFSFQRRVMDGGTCEATPFQLNGYLAGGIAIPLRNYHNQGRSGVMPEGIHLVDAVGGAALLLEMISRIGELEATAAAIRARWDKRWETYSGRLQESP